jgi:hypothetical protein
MFMPSAVKNARAEALREAPPNTWVALSDDESRVIAIGATYEEVVKKSEEVGVKEPILIKTPSDWFSFSV